MKKALLLKSALALALAAPLLASAESQLVVGTGSATARLDVQVIIPRVLFLAVGTGEAGTTTDPTIDTLTFDYTPTPAAVGSGIASAGQNVNVRVRGNNGQIALTAATTGALTNATADTIPWSEITVSSDQVTLPTPTIPLTGTGAGSNVTLNTGKVTDRTAVWTYAYRNTAVVAPGTYGTTNGRVTYTASMP
ncbi:hypothetical protein [Hydrogenophaga sp.]|uniref:hypothetical protein n=1 Tax=Hydrogenophaga sp. TaxID=1904254 RepID=UPI002FC5818C